MNTMGSKRRTDDKIIYLILDICQDGALKTNIIHGANLNYTTVNRYLEILVKSGMVTELGKKPTIMFKTTSKGSKFKKKLVGLHLQINNGWIAEKSFSTADSNREGG
ncbi:MAG: winged helix-turn-helix domain-containing protein [Methanotrichaceae archaeon]